MLAMVDDTPQIPLDRLSGSKTHLMIGLSKLVDNRGSALLMTMPCLYCAEVASCTFLSLENPQTRIMRDIQLYSLQDPMNGILQSWDFTYDGSLLSPITPMLPLTLTLMNLGITPIGQSKLSISWMTHPSH